MSKMLFEALFFVRIKNIKYSWNLFHYLIEINYSKVVILSKKRNISKVRQNLKYEIEAIRSHHNLKWVKLELYLHIKRDIFWRKNTEYELFIHHTGSKIFVLKYLVFPPGIEMKCQINFAPNNNSCLFCSNFRMSQLWGCVY